MVKGGKRTVLADGLIAAPSNVGPRTMPDYDALAAQAVSQRAAAGGARVRRPAGRSVLHRPGSRVRHAQPPRSRDRHALWLQRARDRDRGAGDDGVRAARTCSAPTRARAARSSPSARGTAGDRCRCSAWPIRSSTRRSSARRTRTAGTRPSRTTRRAFLDYYHEPATRHGAAGRLRRDRPRRCSTSRACC